MADANREEAGRWDRRASSEEDPREAGEYKGYADGFRNTADRIDPDKK